MEAEHKKKIGVIRKIIYCAIALTIGGFLSNYLAKENARSDLSVKEAQFNNEFDSLLVKMNAGLPKEVAPNVTLDKITKEDKIFYQTYTLKNISSSSVDSVNTKQNETSTLSRYCNLEAQKKSIIAGYSYVFIYNVSDKKDVFRMIADKGACAKYW